MGTAWSGVYSRLWGALVLSVKDGDKHVRGSFQVEIGKKAGGTGLGWPSCSVQQAWG